MRNVLGMLLALAASEPALATTGLQWQWSDGTVRSWHIVADVLTPSLIQFRALNNTDVRVGRFRVELVLRCIKERDVGKAAFELRCFVDDVGLQAAPVEPDRGRLLPVLDEFDESYRGSFLEVALGADGRVKTVGFEGFDDRIRRYREIATVMRLVAVRAVAGLDLQLPKGGDDGGSPWRLNKALAMSMVSDVGTVGSLDGASRVAKVDGDVVIIESTGRGTFGSGEEVAASGTPEIANLYDLSMQSAATFDVKQGFLMDRSYHVEGNATAGSVAATGGKGSSYVQDLRMTWLAPGTAVQIEPNAELDAVPTIL
jgi:hypothetical protein